MDKSTVSLDELNNLFFIENGVFKPLYDDLKTTKMSESQIRVTMLLALRNALDSGDFEADVDTIRQECTERKCFDGNFSNNFKNNKSLFDFTNYDKSVKKIRLSEEGKTRLSQVIKELQ